MKGLSEKIANLTNIIISKISEIIYFIFIEINKDLISDQSIDTLFPGSTCCSIIFTPKIIISITVGDSRCDWKIK